MTATWIAFLSYAAAAIGLGWLARRHRDEGAAYWTAGRRLGAGSVGLSISAGFLSVSWSCVYAVQLFYWYGLGGVWLITVPWLLALAGIHLLAGRYRELPAFSQPEMVGQRFGTAPRRVVATALAGVFLAWGGAEVYVAATLLAPDLAVPVPAAILLIGAVVAAYAAVGGFRAVVDTDKLQYALVALYILAMAWLAHRGLAALPGGAGALAPSPGGWPGVGAVLPGPGVEAAKSGESWASLLSPGLGLAALTLAAYLPGWLFETDLWLRVQAARDPRAARRGVLLAALNAVLFVGVLPLWIGVAALQIFPVEGGVFPAAVGAEGDAIFAALVEQFAPPWLRLGVVVGLVAAAMSTIDTCTNVTALSVAYDLFGLHRRPRGRLYCRLAAAGAVLAACLFALELESLWDIFYLSSGILTTTVAFPVAAVFLPRVAARAVTWSAAGGLLGTTAAYAVESWTRPGWEPAGLSASGLGYILWGLAAAAAGALLGQLTDPAERLPQLAE